MSICCMSNYPCSCFYYVTISSTLLYVHTLRVDRHIIHFHVFAMLLFHHSFFLLPIYIVLFVCCLVVCFELGVTASLSSGMGVRFAYIPPSPDPTNSFAICGIYWVWLLL
ncbi:hypothetical protein HanHA300_Chr09g0335811 [Helianthus annuus]|nr:hypothetical protein HanHA300_Chr09g0335811 [Helianthus annuus]